MSKPIFNEANQIVGWRYSADELSRVSPAGKIEAPKDSGYYYGDGHDWYMLNPFSGSRTPWERGKPVEKVYPKGFLEVFAVPGPPVRTVSGQQFREDAVRWEQALSTFKQAGWPIFPNVLPAGATAEELARAQAIFNRFGMGAITYHENVYGWWARWPHNEFAHLEPWYMIEADDTWQLTHLTVARWQRRMQKRGANIPDSALVPFARKGEELNPT